LSGGDQAATLAEAAVDVGAVADAYGLDRFALIGVSGGAPYAIAAAAANLDRVVLLALAGPVGPCADLGQRLRLSWLHRLTFRRLAWSSLGSRGFFLALRHMIFEHPDTAYAMLMRRVRPSDRETLARPEVKANLQAAMREGLRRGVDGAVQDLRLYCAPWQLQLAEIDVPAIIWQGSDDAVVPPAAAYALAQMLPNCRLDVIPAGHYWVFDQFGIILDAVAAALRADAEASTQSRAEPPHED
jgi:pimeloyl-ACP methyl ester carboxylesterase